MENLGADHRPNLLFTLAGVVLIVAGLGLTIYGLVSAVGVVQNFDPFRGDGPPVRIADGMATAFWGIIVLTIGRYLWRGARKRGARDRFGRLLIIVAYVLVGFGLDGAVHSAVRIWGASADRMQEALVRTLVTMLVWGLAAAVPGTIGLKLASEKALAKVEMNVGF